MIQSTKTLLVIICAFLLGACNQAYTEVATQTCSLNLQVFVRQGSNVNYSISGHVDFGSNTWSSFNLNVVEKNGLSHPGYFSFNGQVINFFIDTEKGRIFATGIMESSLATCSGSGGGTLSGPKEGDLGDWRGEWVVTALPTPPVQPATTNQPSLFLLIPFCIYSPFILIGLYIAVTLFRLFAPYRFIALFKRTSSSKPQTSGLALRKISPTKKPTLSNEKEPLAEYLVTYTADDKLFDLSFPIEQSSRDLGECGITIAKVLDEKLNQATALELWLFTPQGVQSVSKVLASSYCFSEASLRQELEQIGPVIPIRVGGMVTLETKEIMAKAKILELEYEPNSSNHQSIFKKVVIQIEIWVNKV